MITKMQTIIVSVKRRKHPSPNQKGHVMADTNTLYAGAITLQGLQELIDYADLKSPSVFGLIPANDRAIYRKRFVMGIDTIKAIRVPYTGNTQSDRQAWLTERITAINNRVFYIKSEIDEGVKSLKLANKLSENDPIVGAIESAFNLVPLIGPILSRVTIAIEQSATQDGNAALQLGMNNDTAFIQSYINDLGEVAKLRNTLYAELQAIPKTPTDPTKDPNYQAPFVIPTWYYYAGAAILILLFVWYRRRKLNRRKR